jgi:hypothetical protein
MELPSEFVATALEGARADVLDALRARAAVVDVSGLDRAAQAAAIGRAVAFVGGYGPQPVVAVLCGVDALALATEVELPPEDDLLLVTTFLTAPPFGRLTVLDAGASAETVAEQAAALVQGRLRAVATV